MLNNTQNADFTDLDQEITGCYETLDLVAQTPPQEDPGLGDESLYMDESGAVVARNPRFGEAPQAERMDLLVVERADGRPALEISAMVPEHLAGTHRPTLTRMAQYAPESADFSAVWFGDERDPIASGIASVRPEVGELGSIRVSTDRIALTVQGDAEAGSIELSADRVEVDVPFRFAVADQAPEAPNAGLAYFDTTRKTLRVFDGSSWISMG